MAVQVAISYPVMEAFEMVDPAYFGLRNKIFTAILCTTG